VTNRNEPGDRAEGVKQRSIGEPNATGEILIVDYVMLDFIDECFTPREIDQREPTTKPWRHD
jgi:hypothetical protein